MIKKYIFIILIIFLITILLLGCSKEYRITVKYNIKESDIFSKTTSEITRTDTYKAVKIIEFSDKKVIFIDKEGKEIYVSGDYIEIVQYK